MIGRPQWFTYRTFGWGLAPKTWQGYVYIAAAAVLIGGTAALSMASAAMPWIAGALIAILLIDVLHIMVQLPRVSDERENYHQLVIERNCSFAAIAALAGVALYQTYQNRASLEGMMFPFDWSILVVLAAMLLVKVATTLYMRWKA